MISTNKIFKIESLPPSEGSAYQHALRVFLQVSDWKFLQEAHRDPVDWGWVLRNGEYFPIYSKEPVAPADLLKFVRYNCKLTSKNPCLTNCSCKKDGLHCVVACGNCRGDGCQNEAPKFGINETQNDEVDYDRNIFDIFNELS